MKHSGSQKGSILIEATVVLMLFGITLTTFSTIARRNIQFLHWQTTVHSLALAPISLSPETGTSLLKWATGRTWALAGDRQWTSGIWRIKRSISPLRLTVTLLRNEKLYLIDSRARW